MRKYITGQQMSSFECLHYGVSSGTKNVNETVFKKIVNTVEPLKTVTLKVAVR